MQSIPSANASAKINQILVFALENRAGLSPLAKENPFNSNNKELCVHFHTVFGGKYVFLSIYKYMLSSLIATAQIPKCLNAAAWLS